MPKKPSTNRRPKAQRARTRGRGRTRAGVTWRDGGNSQVGGAFAAGIGARTQSGERVTDAAAMGLSAFYAGVRNLSEDLAKLPKAVVETLKPRGRRVLGDHPLTQIFDLEWNRFCSAFTGVATLQQWALCTGNGVAEIELTEGGEVAGLWPIHTSRIQLKIEGGAPVYYVSLDDLDGRIKAPVPYRHDEVFHLRGAGDQWQGWSLVQLHAETLGLGIASRGFAASFFGNDTAIGNVVSLAGRIPKAEREQFRQDLEKAYAGARRAHKVLVLDSDAKLSRMGLPPQEAQFIETQEWGVEDVARLLRMPPHKVGHLKRASGWSTLEASNTDYVVDALMPWVVRWEQEASRKLLRRTPALRLKFFFQGLMRGDFKARTEGYQRLVVAGVMTPNEARELEDMNPSEDPGADELWMQGAMAPMRVLSKGPRDPAPTAPAAAGGDDRDLEEPAGDPAAPEDSGVRRSLLQVLAERVGAKAAAGFRRHAERYRSDAPAFMRWLGGFQRVLEGDLTKGFGAVLGSDAPLWARARAAQLAAAMAEDFAEARDVRAPAYVAGLIQSAEEILR